MGTAVVLLALFIIAVYALKGTIKHFMGQGGCCGGGLAPERTKKKLKGEAVCSYLLKIEGMHCEHCRSSVENALNGMEGVAVRVNLKKGEALVRASRQVEKAEMEEAVKRAGFALTDMEQRS